MIERGLYRLLSGLAAADLFLLMSVVTVDVAGRYVFNRPLPAGYELVQMLMAGLVFLSLPLLSRKNDHITVGLLDHLFIGRAHRVRVGFAHGFSTLVLAFIDWRLWEHSWKLSANADATAVLGIPLAPIGFAASFLVAIAVAILALLTLRTCFRSASASS